MDRDDKYYWHFLARYLRPQSTHVFILGFLLLAQIALQLLQPQIVRFFLDEATSGGSLQSLTYAGVLFIVVALITQGIVVLTTYFNENIAWRATNNLRFDMAEHYLNLDASIFKNHTSGEIIERIDGDVNALSNFFSKLVILVVSNVILVIGVLILLFREDWRVGLALAPFSVITLFVLIRIRPLATPYWVRVRSLSADFYSFLGEFLKGTEDVQSSRAGTYVMRRIYSISQDWLPALINAYRMQSAMYMTFIFLFTLGNVIAFASGAALYGSGSITIGTVYLIFAYTEMIRRPIDQIRGQMEEFQRAEASLLRVHEFLSIQSNLQSILEIPPGQSLQNRFSLQVDKVFFSYDNDAPVLHDISFVLEPGETLGLLGRTGSGKTTLAHLILRLYDTKIGKIYLDNVSLPEIPLSKLRGLIGLVPQSARIFQASVRDNLTLFDPTISDDKLIKVLEAQGLTSWINALPNGLQTQLEAGGSNLSAGQAQLIASARVRLSDPGLIILDEATSRLDAITERLLESSMAELLKGRSSIIIAHRLSTIKNVDKILILEDGHILEYGKQQELAEDRSSHFYQMLESNSIGALL